MYTRQHQAHERTSMRRWLRAQGHEPAAAGQEPSDTERLMKQVYAAGGDAAALMADGRADADRSIEERNNGR